VKILLLFAIVGLLAIFVSINILSIYGINNTDVKVDPDFPITNMSIIPSSYDTNDLTILGFMENDWGQIEEGKQVKMSITSYDKNNTLIGVDTGLLEYSIPNFNDKSPFEVTLSIPSENKIVDHVDIQILFYTPLFG
jgi:hypothetical protein